MWLCLVRSLGWLKKSSTKVKKISFQTWKDNYFDLKFLAGWTLDRDLSTRNFIETISTQNVSGSSEDSHLNNQSNDILTVKQEDCQQVPMNLSLSKRISHPCYLEPLAGFVRWAPDLFRIRSKMDIFTKNLFPNLLDPDYSFSNFEYDKDFESLNTVWQTSNNHWLTQSMKVDTLVEINLSF